MNIEKALETIKLSYKIKRPLLMLSSPGIGKSSSVYQAASQMSEEYGETFSVIEVRTSGVRGVCWYPRTCRWAVQICVNDIQYYLGYYKEFTEAVAHRLAAEQCLGYPNCNSTSSAYLYLKEQGIVK